MENLQSAILHYKNELAIGRIQLAYRALLEFMNEFRLRLSKSENGLHVAGSLYEGRMQFTFFSLTTAVLKKDKLKIVVVLLHEEMRLEAWLCGQNKAVQQQWIKILQRLHLPYPISQAEPGTFSILEHVLAEHPEFDRPNDLREEATGRLLDFIAEAERLTESVQA